MNDNIYLLPDLIGENGVSCFPNAKQVSEEPIEVLNYAVFSFIKRLDDAGYPYTAVATPRQHKKAYLYPIKFEGDTPDFQELSFTISQIEQGKIIHMTPMAFDQVDSNDYAVPVKGGDWPKVKQQYHSIAALHHLGIIPDISSPIFSMTSKMNRWTSQLHQKYGTYGSLEDTLEYLYKCIKFSIRFFCIQEAITFLDNIPASMKYCFGALVPALSKATEIETMKHILPGYESDTCPFLFLIHYLRFIVNVLIKIDAKVNGIDDFDNIIEAVHQFQRDHDLYVGNCDIKTSTQISYISQNAFLEPLPIFRIAGIDINLYSEADFPTIQPIDQVQADPIAEQIRLEFNRAISCIPDPKAKIEWMSLQIQECIDLCNNRCSELNQRIGDIEKHVQIMTRMLREVMQESQSAMSRVESATRTLNNVFEAHNKIHGKFDILRDKLFAEQRNTRIILVIGVLFTVIGAVGLLWK